MKKNYYKLTLTLLMIIVFQVINNNLHAQKSIGLKALYPDSAGIVMYNMKTVVNNVVMDETTGHLIPAPFNQNDNNAFFYMHGYNSRNYIDGKAFVFDGSTSYGLANLSIALNQYGLTYNNLSIKLYSANLNEDVYGQNWTLENGIETRFYQNSQFTIFVNDTTPVGFFSFPIVKYICNFNNPYNASDDKIILEAEDGYFYIDFNNTSSFPLIINALIQDVGGKKIKLSTTKLLYKSPFMSIFSHGGEFSEILTGKYYEITNAKIDITDECVIGGNLSFNSIGNYGKKIEFNLNGLDVDKAILKWSFGDGTFKSDTLINNSSSYSYIHNYNNYGDKTVKLIITNFNNPACKDSVTKIVNVKQTDNFGSIYLFENTIGCNIFKFSSNVYTSDTVLYKATWQIDNTYYYDNTIYNTSFTSTGPEKDLQINQAGNHLVKLTLKDLKDTVNIQITKSMNIMTYDTVSANLTAFNLDIPNRIGFKMKPKGGSGKYSFIWKIENNTTFSFSDSITYAFADTNGLKFISAQVKDHDNTVCYKFIDTNIRISSLGNNVISAHIEADKGFACSQDVSFNYYVNYENKYANVLISFGDGKDTLIQSLYNYSYSILSNLSHHYDNPGTYNVSIKAIDQSNSNIYYIFSKKIIIYSEINSSISYTVDNNKKATIIANSTGGSGVFDYKWRIYIGSVEHYFYGKTIQVTFPEYNSYSVTLYTRDLNKINCEAENDYDYIKIQDNSMNYCEAFFTYSVDTTNNKKINFTNYSYSYLQSNPDSLKYNWDFGDGSFSTLKNPVHTYTKNGKFTVKLSINDGFDCINSYQSEIVIGNAANCLASFSYDINTTTKEVTFQNNSSNYQNNCMWYFGDGSTSNITNPKHTYSYAGKFTVSLMILDATYNCIDYVEQIIEVGEINYCYADFDFYNEVATNTVYFSNTSTGGNSDTASIWWVFGDGSTSNLANPIHKYTSPGYYDVCLTIWNNASNCWNTKCMQIMAGSNNNVCQAKFNYISNFVTRQVTFQNISTGNITNYNWNFGDGNVSTLENPSHTYSQAGMYLVELNVKNASNYNSYYYEIVKIDSSFNGIYGDFGYIKGQNRAAGKVDFKGTSFGDVSKVIWSFGDGQKDSTQMNVTHEYELPGTYHVSLTVTNNQNEKFTKTKTVNVLYSINEFEKNTIELKLFPNPAKEELFIDYNLTSSTDVEISIYDALGSEVSKIDKFNSTMGKHKTKISTTNLENGLYFIHVKTIEGSGYNKFIVNK